MRFDYDYLNVENVDVLGKFYMSHDYKKVLNSLSDNRVCFKLKKEMIGSNMCNKIEYHPGILDQNGLFIEKPLKVKYVEIERIEHIEKGENLDTRNQIVNMSFNTYCKDFTEKKWWHIKKERVGRMVLDIMAFDEVVNTINLYIDSGRDLKSLDFTLFNEDNELYLDRLIILTAVDALEIDFKGEWYGKYNDDYHYIFYLKNLPKDRYLRYILIQALNIQCRKVDSAENGVKGYIYNYTQFSMTISSPNTITKEEGIMTINRFKDILKLDMAKMFNTQTRVLENLSKVPLLVPDLDPRSW